MNQTLPEAQQIMGTTILTPAEKGPMVHADSYNHAAGAYTASDDDGATEEELATLRRIASV